MTTSLAVEGGGRELARVLDSSSQADADFLLIPALIKELTIRNSVA